MLSNCFRVATIRQLQRGHAASSVLITASRQKSTDTNNNSNNDDDIDPSETGSMLTAEPIKATMPADGEEGDSDSFRRGRKKGSGREISEQTPGYRGWLETEGDPKYKDAKSGQNNYVGGNRPFPLNPWFRPRAPVPNSKKEVIYAEYLKNPLNNTPRVLGEKFGLSIHRVEAIIKLKAIEHHMVENGEIVAQTKFTKGMESMLGIAEKTKPIKESLVGEDTRISGPRFHAVPEGQSFTAADAAEVLGRQPYQNIKDRLTASKPYVIDYPGLDPKFAPTPKKKLSKSETARLDSLGPAAEQVVAKDESLGSRRWKFVFTDIGKNMDMKDRQVLIREQDGTLKKAGRDYKMKRYGQLWYH